MALSDDEIRQTAWNKAVEAEGTYNIFAKRAKRIGRLTALRDFIGILVPIAVAFFATTNWVQTLSGFRDFALAALGVVAFIQTLVVVWSLITRWDDEGAYSKRAMRDNYEMKSAWEQMGKADVADLSAEYKVRTLQQSIIDSHDIGRNITDSERQMGMRAGLFQFQRSCSVCKKIPTSRSLPRVALRRCGACGGRL